MADAQTIGPYRILEPLGHGGMGVVYRARRAGSERAVALKTVRVPAAHWLHSIRREVDALTRIRHPGVVRIVDHGVEAGRPWYAMDLLEGESLRHFGQRIWSPYLTSAAQRLGAHEPVSATGDLPPDSEAPSMTQTAPGSRRPAPFVEPVGVPPAAAGELRNVLRLVRRICATLAFLHGEGFVNCDLKPENVLLVDGHPVIIDFGLTAHHPGGSGREALESQRAMSGTLPYMSPEQIRGEFVDARSDLYSVGCILYELVVGRPPFTGAPRAIRSQHLSADPTPPMDLVRDVPPELEELLLKMLAKSLTDRYGFADEVAALLARLSGDVGRIPEFPPARPYLYRPRFVGREPLVSRLSDLRDRAVTGAGAFVLLGGESGVGKTRLAMEVTRIQPSSQFCVITQETSALSIDGSMIGAGSAPLQALRPLLQAVADRCHEGGSDVADRLVGANRSVLATYEPSLQHVPLTQPPAAAAPLSVEASRQRLFTCLAETLAAFAREQPVLWVLDDLGWADDLSLDFLKSLPPEYFESTPVFILGTYRLEESTDSLTALAHRPYVTHLTLPRLENVDVASMIGDMLALPEHRQEFVDFVTRQAEGNPFFVTEHVRTAVIERVLYRDQHNAWRFQDEAGAGQDYESLRLPRSLRDLIGARLRKLTPPAQHVGLAAAVLGRDVELSALATVAAVPEEVARRAVDELLRRHVLEQSAASSVRFAHDKLREVAYSQAPVERVAELHARAATTLEAMWRDRVEPARWAILGYHFAAAALAEPALRYLKLAADHARSTYANGDAIRLYQEAIRWARQLARENGDRATGDEAEVDAVLADLLEASGDVLASVGRRDDARAAYAEARERSASGTPSQLARLHRKTGKTMETEHRHTDALSSYESAVALLDVDPMVAPSDVRGEWLQVRIDRLWVYYFLDRVQSMDALIHELAPIVSSCGTPIQRARFLRTHWMRDLRRDRYRATDDTVRIARLALSAAHESGDPEQVCLDQFGLGFVLLFSLSLDEAWTEIEAALHLAVRAGDVSRQARCLTYLTVIARMRGHRDSVRTYVDRSAAVARRSGTQEYLAAADANRAWLVLRDGDVETASRLARSALDVWRALPLVYPLQWLALVPLLRAHLAAGAFGEASSCAAQMLEPSQQPLPAPAEAAFTRAVEEWRRGAVVPSRTSLTDGLKALEGTVCA